MSSAIIILAAGSSSRLGKPKQLLSYNGKTLIQHIISVAANSNSNEIIVVLGANQELISKEIADNKIRIVINHHWSEGIASSIRTGLKFLQEINPAIECVIFAVCDQPFISSLLLNDLIAGQIQTGKTIIASSYENTIGTPVLFHNSLFAELSSLTGDFGAKKIIMQHQGDVATVSFPGGNIDIDTNEEYQALMK